MCLHSCTVRGCTVFRNELFCVVDNPEYEKQVGTAGQRNINSLGLLMKNFSAMPLTHQAVYSYLHNLDVEPRRYVYVCVFYLNFHFIIIIFYYAVVRGLCDFSITQRRRVEGNSKAS